LEQGARGPGQTHVEGFDLHANVGVGTPRAEATQAVCRYLLRPLLADDRLRVLGDGRVPMHCIGLNPIIAVQMAMPGKLVTPSKTHSRHLRHLTGRSARRAD